MASLKLSQEQLFAMSTQKMIQMHMTNYNIEYYTLNDTKSAKVFHIPTCPLWNNYLEERKSFSVYIDAMLAHIKQFNPDGFIKQSNVLSSMDVQNKAKLFTSIAQFGGYHALSLLSAHVATYDTNDSGVSHIEYIHDAVFACAAMEYEMIKMNDISISSCFNKRLGFSLNMQIIVSAIYYCYHVQLKSKTLLCLFLYYFVQKHIKYDLLDNEKVFKVNQLYRGYFMIHYPKSLSKILQNMTYSQIIQKLQKLQKYLQMFDGELVLNKQLIRTMAKELKSLSLSNLKAIGEQLISDSFKRFYKIACKYQFKHDESMLRYLNLNFEQHLYMLADLSFLNKDYVSSKLYFCIAICAQNGLYQRLISLRRLCEVCYAVKEYLLALKILNCAFILCKISPSHCVLLPSFVNGTYRKQKKKIKKKIKLLCCSYCNCIDISKLRACSGCMKYVYCSRKCQKKHWNTKHKSECDKQWIESYKMLKEVIFCRL
eukprot:36911_1